MNTAVFPPGHFLVAVLPVGVYLLLRDRQLPSPQLVGIAAFASQFPDLIDKPLYHESIVTPSGRVGTHSLPIAIPIAIAVCWYAYRTDRPRAGAVFVFAYATHIVGDVYKALLAPNRGIPSDLFWPFVEPIERPLRPFWAGPELLFVHLWTLVSIVILAIAGVFLLRDVAKQSGFLPRS
jgi:membrane-bound metal-dependent hydrolase YbcI (DUF457 family)